MAEHHKIANGSNNIAGLKFLWELSPPLFENMLNDDTLNEWHSEEAIKTNANLVDLRIGTPWDVWVIPQMTMEEQAFLHGLGPTVTIRTLNKLTGVWTNYNAIKSNPELKPENWDRGVWENLKYTFKRLLVP